MITQFSQALATKPDGIAIMGHPGDDAFDPLIKQAMDQNILVTVMNTELPKAEAAYATKGLGYVGAVLYDAGAALANEAIARGGLKSGDRAFVWGLEAQAGRGERTKGIHDTLQKAGLTVDYLEIDDATNKDPANGTATFTGYVSAHPDVKAMFIDHGNLTSTIPTYMKAANLAAGSVFMAGFDASAATVQGIKDGYINLVIDQQQYLQGFQAVEQLCLTKKYGFSGLFVNTGGGFIDKSNVDVVDPTRDGADPLVAGPTGPMTSEQAGGRDGARQPASRRRAPPRASACVQVVRRRPRPRGHRFPPGCDRGRRSPRRQRGRQVDTHQDHHGRPPARPWARSCSAASGSKDSPSRRPAHSAWRPSTRSGPSRMHLSLWRNIFMGRAITDRFGFLRVGEMRRATAELMGESMGFTSAVLTPDTSVHGPSGGERQGLAIVRALHFEADIIVLDEPTMGLSLKETEKLLGFVEGIRDAGKSAIFIDHNIFHVYSVADRIVVLDRGRVAGEFPTSRYSLEELMDIMREVASTGTYTEAERYRPGEAPSEAAGGLDVSAVPRTAVSRRTGVGTRLAPWASQIGIITAFLLLWVAFVVLAPRTFLDTPIYLSFAQTTPYFAIIAMSLTMVIVAGDIDLSFPATMSLGMVGFVALWQATGNVGLGVVGALGVGVLCGLFNGFFVTFIGIPALVVTIGTQFLFRGLALVLIGGHAVPAGQNTGFGHLPSDGGQAVRRADGVLLVPARDGRHLGAAQPASHRAERLCHR